MIVLSLGNASMLHQRFSHDNSELNPAIGIPLKHKYVSSFASKELLVYLPVKTNMSPEFGYMQCLTSQQFCLVAKLSEQAADCCRLLVT